MVTGIDVGLVICIHISQRYIVPMIKYHEKKIINGCEVQRLLLFYSL